MKYVEYLYNKRIEEFYSKTMTGEQIGTLNRTFDYLSASISILDGHLIFLQRQIPLSIEDVEHMAEYYATNNQRDLSDFIMKQIKNDSMSFYTDEYYVVAKMPSGVNISSCFDKVMKKTELDNETDYER